MRQLLDYLPEHLKNVEELRQIQSIVQNDINDLFYQRYRLLDNLFIATADKFGIERYENIYGVKPDYSLSDEERKFALSAMIIEKRPITYRFLVSQLEQVCGKGSFEIDANFFNYQVNIRLALSQKNRLQFIENLVTDLLPANLELNFMLAYNRYGDYSEYRYSEMADITNKVLRED